MEFFIGMLFFIWFMGAIAGSWTGEDKVNGRF